MFIFLIIVILNPLTLNTANAQEGLTPQLVTATRHFEDCTPPGDFKIEIYNVGSQGGAAYSDAKYVFPNGTFVNTDQGISCVIESYSEVYGTFSGGPNGTITFPPGNSEGLTTCQVLEGKTIECTYVIDLLDLGKSTHTWVFNVQNPEAFQAAASPTAGQTATTATGCTPNVRGLDPSKPGDVISPGASYLDAAGKETGVIQDRWFFNGKESTSIVWDGKPVTVELQWTCLDHSGFSTTFTIPAYQEPAAPAGGAPDSAKPVEPSGGSDSQADPKGITPTGTAVIVGGVLGIIGAIGVGIRFILKGKPPVPPAVTPPPAPPPAPQVTPVQYTPPSPPVQHIPPGPTEPPVSPPTPRPTGLTPAQRADLINIRGQMENEAEKLKTKWRANRDAVAKLKEILKKNLLKFTFKKGFEVSDWIMDSPAEVISKIAIDPIMEKVYEKHDTSQDSNIILKINNRIQQLQNEMQEMVKEERYLQTEINKINQKLGDH
jgi:hypothetical protein